MQNTGASGRDRRMNPTKTAYMVYYQDISGSGYQWSEQALTRELGQKIVDAGTTVERRVLADATEYEVIYPSGYSRACYAYDEKSPIEGSSCYLQWEKADDYEKTYDCDIHILDESGSVLYRYPDVGSKAMRGSVQEDSKIWVCAEHWTAPGHNGYVEGWLKESDLLLIDLSDGEILFQDKAGENEFYGG